MNRTERDARRSGRCGLLLLAALLLVPGGAGAGRAAAAGETGGGSAGSGARGVQALERDAVAVRTAAETGTSVSLSAAPAAVGGEVTVTVTGDGLADLYAFEMTLNYDPAKLEYVSAAYGLAGGMGVPASVSGGKAAFAYTQIGSETPGMSGSRKLLTVVFRAVSAGKSELSLSGVKLVNSRLESAAPKTLLGAEAAVAASGGGTEAGAGTGTGSAGPAAGAGSGAAAGGQAAQPVTVTPEQAAAASAGGRVTLALPPGAETLRLPAGTLAAIGGQALRLTGGSGGAFALEIPAGLMKSLGDRAAAAEGALVLKAEPVSAASTAALLARSGGGRTADGGGLAVSSAGEAYAFSLAVEKNGTAEPVREFAEPLTLTLRAAASSASDQDITGIYYIAEDGAREYAGGSRSGEVISASIRHFSTYAVLRVERTFPDMPRSHWAYGAVRSLAAKGIAGGTGAAFEPARSVTRAEFAAMLSRLLRLMPAAGKASFADVPAGAWYEGEVAAAAAAGIVSGRSERVFDPSGTLTRQEMAVMLTKAYAYSRGPSEVKTAPPVFADMDRVASWAAESVRTAAALGLVQGRSGGLFAATAPLSRAEAAQALYGLTK
ncbi:S-layer homology domain-containing protein [Paenibacillus spiritus]|nr:S-layer homology domain-containing protein [Paenibacillus spiritus]